ncbi:MAG TPA: carbohydrate kinase [Planctomycetaceae bacterium]
MRPTVIGIGEILWDLFPSGPRFGGAPANFACHAAALGAEAFVVGRVGDDDLGRAAIAALRDLGVGTGHVAVDADRPTGTVAVETDASGKARYEFAADAAWDRMRWSDDLAALAARADAVCFGTLGQRDARSRETIRRFVRSTRPDCLRVFDVNLRKPFFDDAAIRESLDLANVLKLSDDELPVVAAAFAESGSEAEIMSSLAGRFRLRAVALTRGERGAALLCDGHLYECPGRTVAVKDTVGAGDAFAAALTTGLLRRDDPETVLRRAVEIGAFVCTRPGATPALPDDLREPFLR